MMFDRLKRALGLGGQNPDDSAYSPVHGERMAVLNLRVGQRVTIPGRVDHATVVGKIDYEKDGHIWSNFRLLDHHQREYWLALEFWEDGPQTFLYESVQLFEMPASLGVEMIFKTSQGVMSCRRSHDEPECEARVAAVDGDVEAVVGSTLRYLQYERVDHAPGYYLAVEIWDGVRYYSTGVLLDMDLIEVRNQPQGRGFHY